MPSNKNAMIRFQILDNLLSNPYKYYTIQDLNEECNEKLVEYGASFIVSKRQTEKDIKYLEEESPFFVELERIPIQREDKNGRVYTKKALRYKNKGFSIFKKELSEEESCLLLILFQIIGQFDGIPNLERLNTLKQTLKVNEYLPIISLSKNPLEKKTVFGELFIYISNRAVLNIDYQRKDGIKPIILHPYLLKEYNNRWFLIGYAEEKKNNF